jgi:hypothetical protein
MSCMVLVIKLVLVLSMLSACPEQPTTFPAKPLSITLESSKLEAIEARDVVLTARIQFSADPCLRGCPLRFG